MVVACIYHFCNSNGMGASVLKLYDWNWHRGVGCKQDSWLGLGYHELRLVDRYWSRRNSYLCYLIIIPSALENGCEPFCRGYDDLCRCLRRYISTVPYRPSMA